MKTTIELAREVGARAQQHKNRDVEYLFSVDQIERLLAAEREACAKAVEVEAHMFETLAAAKSLASTIRARGETK